MELIQATERHEKKNAQLEMKIPREKKIRKRRKKRKDKRSRRRDTAEVRQRLKTTGPPAAVERRPPLRTRW